MTIHIVWGGGNMHGPQLECLRYHLIWLLK